MREQCSIEDSQADAVRVIHHYIGEGDEEPDQIRVPVEDLDALQMEHGEKAQIIIDSGADAAVFLSSWMHAGVGAAGKSRRLQDAQGNEIPTERKRDVEIWLQGMYGQRVCDRERVTISDAVSQPIPCHGKLKQQGWGINASEQTLGE